MKLTHRHLSHSVENANIEVYVYPLIPMLQDPKTIRYFQRLSDTLVELWRRRYGSEELRLFADGFVTALRYSQDLDPLEINRLEQEVANFLSRPDNFEPPDFMYQREKETF
jgi:hypothetical protein